LLQEHLIGDYQLGTYTEWNEQLIYMEYVDKRYGYQEITASPVEAYRYQGNLFGLFKSMGVNPSMFFYTMYINGLTNPLIYDGKKLIFKVPVMPPIPES
jgi:hypothetical protein